MNAEYSPCRAAPKLNMKGKDISWGKSLIEVKREALMAPMKDATH